MNNNTIIHACPVDTYSHTSCVLNETIIAPAKQSLVCSCDPSLL